MSNSGATSPTLSRYSTFEPRELVVEEPKETNWWNSPTTWSLRNCTHPMRRRPAHWLITWCKLVGRHRVLTIAAVVALFGFLSAGLQYSVLSSEPDADILVSWRPAGSWRQQNQQNYIAEWGDQTIDQIIITPSKTSGFLTDDPERTQLLAAYDIVEKIKNLQVGDDAVDYQTLCFKPAAPTLDTCLWYNPFFWWGETMNRDEILADNVSKVLSETSAKGPISGLEIRRGDVYGKVQTEEEGEVTDFSAMMVWLFIDISPPLETDEYVKQRREWENALLKMAIALNEDDQVPVKVSCAISTSKQDEISDGVLGDMLFLYAAMGVMFVLLSVFGMVMTPAHKGIVAVLTSILGLTMLGALGSAGWAVKLGWIVKFDGSALVVMMPIALGSHVRLLASRTYRPTKDDVESVFEDIIANVLLPYCYICTGKSTHTCTCGLFCACLCIQLCMCMRTCVFVCSCVCLCVCLFVCMFVKTYVLVFDLQS
eukprot:m.152680 g.152680  ORF g.152680 m.152680 type:complete len:483 (+) comp30811_c0_seq2:332-1780(+)